MLEAVEVREANAPLAGRRMLSASFGSVGIVRRTRPRSAVAVSSNAPGLAPLTGFSRSGDRSRSSLRSDWLPNRRFGLAPCRGLEAQVALVVLDYVSQRRPVRCDRPRLVLRQPGPLRGPTSYRTSRRARAGSAPSTCRQPVDDPVLRWTDG